MTPRGKLWFAWHPVRVSYPRRRWVWLRWVRRWTKDVY